MSTPHACPVCGGSGKIFKPGVTIGDTPTFPSPTWYNSCSACGGTGIVWEQDLSPNLPRYPEFVPYSPDPVAPFHFPEGFEFPKEIVEDSKKSLIKTLKKWISDLEGVEKKEEPIEDVDNDFCD